jgi:hypothetical protein
MWRLSRLTPELEQAFAPKGSMRFVFAPKQAHFAAA